MKTATTSTKKRISSDDALALWRSYKATGDVQARNRLVMTYAPLVKYIVFKKVRELPARCEVEDFISCGLEALIASIDRYDPSKGATLEQFAWTRIHGAVIDELRRREDDIAVSDVTSLNTLVVSDDETNVERIDTIADDDERSDPEHAATATEAKARFRRAFELLPRREREVAVLLYVKNLTLREIGEILGVSESRVCQIHTQLKRTLKQQLAGESALFSAVG